MNLRSVQVTRFLGIVTLIVVLLAGWFLLVGPTVGRLGEVDQRMTDAQDRNTTMSLQLAQLRAQADALPATQTTADRLEQVFPPTADQPGFFAQVNEAAAQAGIGASGITDITLGTPVVPGDAEPDASGTNPADSLPATPADPSIALQLVTVTASGTYEDLNALLGNLEQMRRALFVTGVDLAEETSEGGSGVGTMTITVTGVTFVAEELDPPSLNQPSSQTTGDSAGTDQASG